MTDRTPAENDEFNRDLRISAMASSLEDIVDSFFFDPLVPDNEELRDRAHQLRRDIQEWHRSLPGGSLPGETDAFSIIKGQVHELLDNFPADQVTEIFNSYFQEGEDARMSEVSATVSETPIPRDLCGVRAEVFIEGIYGGCIHLADHEGKHSWES